MGALARFMQDVRCENGRRAADGAAPLRAELPARGRLESSSSGPADIGRGTDPRPVTRSFRIRAPRPALQQWAFALAAFGSPLCMELAAQRGMEAFNQDRGRLFSLPRAQDDAYEWSEARQEIEAGQFDSAVQRLHTLLQQGRPGVVSIDTLGERFLGLRTAVTQTLRDLPPAGLEAYEKLVQREAAELLRDGRGDAGDPDLQLLATRFPTSSAGRLARRRLGDLALVRGDGLRAEQHYRAALDATPTNAAQARAELELRMLAARCIAPEAQIDPAQLPEQARGLVAELAGIVTTSPDARAFLRGWPAYGGGGDGSRQMRAHVGRLEPRGSADYRPRGSDRLQAMHAIGGLSGILLNDGVSVIALDALNGSEQWRGDGPLAGGPIDDYEEAINRDMVLAPALGDGVVVAGLMIPVAGESMTYRQSIHVIQKIPARRLFAFDRATGKLLWSHWDREDGPVARRFAGHDICGPPLVHGDTIYVATHDQTGAIAYYAAAYDLHTGQPRWRRLICSSQQEVNMFGNARFEFAATPLALRDGILVGCTNLGVCYALDAASGELRWITAYPVIPLPRTQLTHQQERDIYFANNPLVIREGVVACTPLDSMYALGLELSSGAMLWRLDYRAQVRGAHDIRWLLGVHEDEFVFSGRGVVAVKARPARIDVDLKPEVRSVCSPERVGMGSDDRYWSRQIARGALADGLIYFPSNDRINIFDLSGNSDPRANEVRQGGIHPGNLLLADGLLVSLRGGPIDIYYSPDGLLSHAEAMVRRNRDDPSALLALATLLRVSAQDDLLGPRADQAEKRYLQGLELLAREGISRSAPIHRKLARGLFELELARARWLAERRPREALVRLQQARDRAPDPESWLQAQDYVLDLVQDRDAYLAELARMVREHGDREHEYPGLGRLPVQVFALWQQAQRAAPPQAIAAAQELLDRFGDVPLGARPAGSYALQRQRELIAEHGAAVYAPIEARATAALEAARGQSELLRLVAVHYPLSAAARQANLELLDLALARGDVETAVRAYADAARDRDPDPGITRRTIEAARIAGNLALARALTDRLLAAHGRTVSDFAPDRPAGTLQQALAEQPWRTPAPLPPRARPTQLPLEVTARMSSPSPGTALRVRKVTPVPGFAPKDGPEAALAIEELPLYVAAGSERLLAFDLDAPEPFRKPLFDIACNATIFDDRLWLCGTTLAVVEASRVRGVDCRTGEVRWSYEEPRSRILTNLGVSQGVLHLFSQLPNAGDGGVLIGLEPISGASLFRHVYPALRESVPPGIGAGSAWVLDFEAGEAFLQGNDLTSGRPTARIALDRKLLRGLRMDPSDLRGRRGRAMLQGLIADPTGFYLPFDEGNQTGPRVAALHPDGTQRWIWTGTFDRQLLLCARHADRLLLVESNNRGSRFLQLDLERGHTLDERTLRQSARPLNWSYEQPPQPAPDILLLADADGTQNLTCLTLRGDSPSFFQPLHPSVDYIAGPPAIGENFVAVLGGHKSNRDLMVLQVMDLQQRQSLLPDRRQVKTLELPQGRLTTHGRAILVHAHEGLALLGPRAPTDR